MRTVISHFRNEEYLLPWWLAHHREMFDYGILIDYGSTDASVDICKEMVPHWEMRSTRNLDFAPGPVDAEVMAMERRVAFWKMALNTTEFLCADLDSVEENIIDGGYQGTRIQAVAMVDPPDLCDSEPDVDIPLVHQRNHGFFQTAPLGDGTIFMKMPDYRDRLYHRYADGQYGLGRHSTHHDDKKLAPAPTNALILWFAYSPWTPKFRQRKLDTNSQRFPPDPNCSAEPDVLDEQWMAESSRAINLYSDSHYIRAQDAWNGSTRCSALSDYRSQPAGTPVLVD